MAASNMQVLAGTLLVDDGTCVTGALPTFTASGTLVQKAPSTSISGLGATYRLPVTEFIGDTGLALTATASGAAFGIANTDATSLSIITAAASGSTVTAKALREYTIPQSYHAGDNITITVNAQYTLNGGTAGTKTVIAAAYLISDAGTEGANLVATTAATITTAAADYAFVITGTTLTAGARISIVITEVIQDTASGLPTAQINSVRLS